MNKDNPKELRIFLMIKQLGGGFYGTQTYDTCFLGYAFSIAPCSMILYYVDSNYNS